MGLFKSKEEKQAEILAEELKQEKLALLNHKVFQGSKIYEEAKQKQIKIAKKGIASSISAENYSKVIIEQNQAIIDMLAVIAISGGAIASGAALMHQQDYNKRIKQYL